MAKVERTGKWLVHCVSSGFMGPSIARSFESPKEALEFYERAMTDYKSNGWSHSHEPTLYKRCELTDMIEQEVRQDR